VPDFRQPDSLRVLIADGRQQRLQHVTRVIEALGHTVIAEATDIGLVALLTSENLPDVAIVCVDESSEQALHLIRQIVKESSCPVIALLDVEDPDFVNRAAQIGVFAYIVNANPEQLQSAFGIALRRFAEYHGKAPSIDARLPNAPRAFSWNVTASTSTPLSSCFARNPAGRTHRSSPSPRQSPTRIRCSRTGLATAVGTTRRCSADGFRARV
jgi:DNA-binding NarL/FixJ family response regulator